MTRTQKTLVWTLSTFLTLLVLLVLIIVFFVVFVNVARGLRQSDATQVELML